MEFHMNLLITGHAAMAVGALGLSSILAAPPPVQPPRPTTPPPALPDQAETEVSYTVRLIEAGENPRVLRVTPAADLAQRTESNISMTMNTMGMTMKMPGLQITNDTFVTKVDEESGDISYHFEITNADIVGGESVNPMIAAQMRQEIAAMVGTEGDVTISSTGVPREAADTEADDGGMPIDPSSMAMGVALPEEAVGVGGIWEITSRVQQQGFEVEQVMRIEIVSMDDESIDVKLEVTQSAPEQTMTQQGMTMKLTQFSSSGAGTGTVRLDRLVPEKSDLTQKTTMTVVIEGGPMNGQQMTQSIDSTMSMVSEVIEHPGDGG
jgi:hypothetical protein